jgi:hypothetical protein
VAVGATSAGEATVCVGVAACNPPPGAGSVQALKLKMSNKVKIKLNRFMGSPPDKADACGPLCGYYRLFINI